MRIKIYTLLCSIAWVFSLFSFLEFIALPFIRGNEPYIFFPSNLMYEYIGLTRIDVLLCTFPSIVFLAITLASSNSAFKNKSINYIGLAKFNIIEFLLFNVVISLFLFGSKSNYFVYHFYVIVCLTILISIIYFWKGKKIDKV